MLSYKDKLLFLSFQNVISTYTSIVESELNIEAQSLYKHKKSIPTSLSSSDKQYAYRIYDNMLSHNNDFQKVLHKINTELELFYTLHDFTFSINSVDNHVEIATSHLKEISTRL